MLQVEVINQAWEYYNCWERYTLRNLIEDDQKGVLTFEVSFRRPDNRLVNKQERRDGLKRYDIDRGLKLEFIYWNEKIWKERLETGKGDFRGGEKGETFELDLSDNFAQATGFYWKERNEKELKDAESRLGFRPFSHKTAIISLDKVPKIQKQKDKLVSVPGVREEHKGLVKKMLEALKNF